MLDFHLMLANGSTRLWQGTDDELPRVAEKMQPIRVKEDTLHPLDVVSAYLRMKDGGTAIMTKQGGYHNWYIQIRIPLKATDYHSGCHRTIRWHSHNGSWPWREFGKDTYALFRKIGKTI